MERVYEQVLNCYNRDDLDDIVLQAIQKKYGDGTKLSPDDLAPVDEFHIRGRDATVELAGLIGDLGGQEVLDIGCGLGGTARYLAAEFDCTVTGIDLTPGFVSLAKKFSQMVGLDDSTKFHEASALELPFDEGKFDIAWMEHVQMNIPSKDQLASEIARALRQEGTFVFHEIFQAGTGDPHYPVPWADEASGSFLVSPEKFRRTLEDAGLEVTEWKDVTESAEEWFATVIQRISESGPPPLGLHLLMGDIAPTKLENVGKNLQENRICVVQGVCRKK